MNNRVYQRITTIAGLDARSVLRYSVHGALLSRGPSALPEFAMV